MTVLQSHAGGGDMLDLVIDRIIPADDDPGALGLGTPRFVRDLLAAHPADDALIAAGLDGLRARGFAELDITGRDRMLGEMDSEAWFERLVTIVSEGFYADPANGGNAGAASWAMIGYEHRLPEGPSGPPPAGQAEAAK